MSRGPRLAALAWLLALGCGAPAAEPVEPTGERVRGAAAPEAEPAASEATTPFPRLVALPPAPRMVVGVDLDVLRRTPLYANLLRSMRGDDPDDLVPRVVLERTRQVTLGAYGASRPTLVILARGPELAGAVSAGIEQLRAAGGDAAEVQRLGFGAYYLSDDMVVAQLADDAVALTFPEHLDDVLRVAAGQGPASPLPPPMRALLDRRPFDEAPLTMVFRSLEGGGSAPLAALAREAGHSGLAGHLEGDELAVLGAARLTDPARAAQLAGELEASARATTDQDVRSARLAEAIRAMNVRTDGAWIEVELRLPPEELERFMDVVRPLSR